MSIRTRLVAVERALGMREVPEVVAFWPTNDPERYRKQVEDARARGHRIRRIIFGVMHQTDTLEEAQEYVAKHRAEHPDWTVHVYRSGTRRDELLAEWEAPLPEWLRGDSQEAGQQSSQSCGISTRES